MEGAEGVLAGNFENSYYAQIIMPLGCPSDSLEDGRVLGYYREFCTIRMCTARQSGHTQAICRVAKEIQRIKS